MAGIQIGSGGETMSGGFQPASGPASEQFELDMCISSFRCKHILCQKLEENLTVDLTSKSTRS